MNGDAQRILNLLLQRYERSKHFRAPGESARGVFLKFDRDTVPEYWDEHNGQRRADLNVAVGQLVARGVLSVRASRYSRDEIERIDLNLDRLEGAYELAGRASRREHEQALAAVAAEWARRWDGWRAEFVQAVVAALESGARLPAGLRPAESELLTDLCRALEALGPSGLPGELPRRIFSQRSLGFSKRLEEIQGSLLRVLRDYWPVPLPDDDREALAEVGIVANPQHVLVAGPVVLDGLDVGAVGTDVGLAASFVGRCRVTALSADRVVTIENLTSFHQFVEKLPERTVALYLGGYHNRVRRQFLLKLAAGGIRRIQHWGDIDLGGFRIFAHLARETGLALEPLLMDVETYRTYAPQGIAFGDSYATELERLLDRAEYEQFWPVITEMLHLRKKVEQEAVVIG